MNHKGTKNTKRLLGALGVLCALVVGADVVDKILVTVGKQVITLSDVRMQHRLECFFGGTEVKPLDESGTAAILDRLIDQALIRREMAEGAFPPADAAIVEQQLQEIRKKYPDAGAWKAALDRYALSEGDLRRLVQFQADVQSFIDVRIRPGLQVTPEAAARHYQEQFLPEARRRGATEPAFSEVREQIVRLLLEQEVNVKLASMLQELRSRTEIRRR
jgi:hypothetical protein